MNRRFGTRRLRLCTVLLVLLLSAVPVAAPANAAVVYVPISGAGSTWSAIAINTWTTNVQQFGMRVDYDSQGSTYGRKQFANGQADFGVSEIPYGLVDNGRRDDPPARKYAYMPVVAGGTSFMYNLKIGGVRVRNLRLSGENITKIFTGVIKNWGDPAIAKDNPGLTLPARKIIPVIRSDGSGTTAQFTLWMSKQYPDLWNAYCAKAGRKSDPCGITSAYPTVRDSPFTGQAGSNNVAGYVKSANSEGAITYVEYSYALSANFPVVKVLNSAGYYVEPTASNVAVALLKATINEDRSSADYLTQNLEGVYANPDRRTYPLSSYSYMIIPTAAEGRFTAAKGVTLGAFTYFFLCEGQQQAPKLGYSPLPINLVKAGLDQVEKIPGVKAEDVNIKSCNNPTFSSDGTNTLAKNAPYPASCDKQGSVQCDQNGKPVGGGGGAGGGGGGNGGGSGGGSGGSGGGNGGGGSGGATGTGTGGAGAGPGTGGGASTTNGSVDPDTGQVIGAGELGNVSNISGTPVPLGAGYLSSATRHALIGVAIVLLMAIAVGPPLITRTLVRRRNR